MRRKTVNRLISQTFKVALLVCLLAFLLQSLNEIFSLIFWIALSVLFWLSLAWLGSALEFLTCSDEGT